MRYLSLFSGIEAATQAWKPLGWECVGVSEIEPFPCAVLEHHYPDIPNLGDVTKITEEQVKGLGQIDLIVFGSPCQNLSVAGNRKGLQGEQSSLFYSAMEIIRYARKNNGLRFALWENVPGSFSSNKGADFSAVVEQMAGLENIGVPENGWGKEGAAVGSNGLLEWSVLDAQWFGLAQRRKRVFAVVDFGEWSSRPPILLERESLRGDSAPSREAGQDFTADVRASATKRGFDKQRIGQYADNNVASTCAARDYKDATDLVVESCQQVVGALCARDCKGVGNQYVAEGKLVVAIAGNIIGRRHDTGGNGQGFDDTGSCYTLTAMDRHAVAFKERAGKPGGGKGFLGKEECCFTLSTNQDQSIAQGSVVRRLTPIECERLQGFPDDFTKIPYRNKPAEDCPKGVRYKALGNSMAVPVMAWIGRKIEEAKNEAFN